VNTADLLERGIRAYTRGAIVEAERCWSEVLALDPGNDRARSYLDVLVPKRSPENTAAGAARASKPPAWGGAVPLPAPAAAPCAVPLPAPATAFTRPSTDPRRAGPPAAVPLPAPAPALAPAPDWLRSPITLPAAPPSVEPPPLPPSAVEPMPERQEHISVTDYVASPWDDGPASVPAVVLDDGDGLDLASVDEQSGIRPLVPDSPLPAVRPLARPRSDVEVWMDGARELFALGDFSGSLEMIEKILRVDPHHTEARLYLEQNESTLTAMYESKLGPGDGIPRLAIGGEEVMWLNLDHRAGFLLAQIDGTVTYEDLFAVSGLPRLDTARILATLLQEGVITS
jgi:hypothetical protein